ncbi:TlpA family protein disulfide reductase [Alteromonas sp. a30]|uniref:TlpA family protein disulfide reductase n=1 Tax=Alteromonas sp. a30 TaxID=2730917 RepID=UPI00227F0335|nr:TlpA disulfide reductase family protein [Alteromonas sp. a30]MCY7294025.1 TlpA family protein disulfide reductase [Alteromonas sp. a30]
MSFSTKLKGLFTRKTLFRFVREIIILAVILIALQMWRTKDMLPTDGSITVEPMQTVSLTGKEMTLAKGTERTLLYFFAPWCRVCNWSIGSLADLGDTSLNIVPVAMDYESLEEVQDFVDRHDMDVDVALGNNEIKKHFEIKGYPSYYLLDENKQVIAKHFGYTTSTQIKLQNWLAL